MTRTYRYATVLALAFSMASTGWAQQAHSLRLGVRADAAPPVQTRSLLGDSTPRWVKWGLAGAVAGGIFFSLAGQSNPDGDRNVIGDAALGAAIGFVIVGGAIALYDAVCAPDSGSRRAGLCGR